MPVGPGHRGPAVRGPAYARAVTASPAEPRRRPALSPSRAADFKECPLLYRFRAIDRLPEPPSRPQVRGVLVHAVLERLFDLPAPMRAPTAARALVAPVWAGLCAADPALPGALFPGGTDDPELPAWLASAGSLLEAWFALEDPRRIEPEARELLVEVELPSGLPLRGYVDRLDTTADGRMRVVDYKTGAAPPVGGEARALFPMKFYALALMLLRGRAPEELSLLYLGGGERWAYRPDPEELLRFARTLEALWAAVREAGAGGDFRPAPSRRCEWCAHRVRCPAWGGTPPPYPGRPGDATDDTARGGGEEEPAA